MGAHIHCTWPRVQLDFVWWYLVFSAITAVNFPLINRNVDQFICTKQKAPDDSKSSQLSPEEWVLRTKFVMGHLSSI